MGYLTELRHNFRPLAAASIGSGTSLPLFAYTNSAFAPHLIADFGWSRAQFALIGLTMLATLPTLPFIGRMVDLLGVRRVALFGTLTILPCYIGYATMSGDFLVYMALFTAVLIVGSTTSTLSYARLIAENFKVSQGLALTVMNCMPAVLAIVIVPLLNMAIEEWGWRTSYLMLGGFAFVAGVVAILLIPSRKAVSGPVAGAGAEAGIAAEALVGAGAGPVPEALDAAEESKAQGVRSAREDYPVILRSKVFWVVIVGMFLCLLATPLHSSQMNLMLVDNGLTAQTAANIVSVYAFGTIVGRIVCGLALDRYPTPIVTAVSMGVPALGYLLLGSDLDAVTVITVAMFLVGLSVGAESDLMPFLVSRYFNIRIFNTTFGLVFTCSFLASAAGALMISASLALADTFAPFLYLVAGTITVGSLLFMALPKAKDAPKIG